MNSPSSCRAPRILPIEALHLAFNPRVFNRERTLDPRRFPVAVRHQADMAPAQPEPHGDAILDATREFCPESASVHLSSEASAVSLGYETKPRTSFLFCQEVFSVARANKQLEEIALRVRKLRRDLGLTQMQLAQHLHQDQTTISKWEKAKARPIPEALLRLSLLVPGDDRLWFMREAGIIMDIEDVDDTASGLKLVKPESRKKPIIGPSHHNDNEHASQKSRQESAFVWDPDLLAFIIDTINAQLEKMGRSPSLGFGRAIANVYAICQHEGRWDSAFILQQFGKVA
jgi:transcriptional regulator with XRE-family HTH domain